MSFIPYPFVRLVLLLIGGIALYLYMPEGIPEFIFLPALAFLFCLLVTIYIINRKFKHNYLNPGFIALCTTFLAGYVLTYYQTGSRDPLHFKHIPEKTSYYRVVVDDALSETKQSWKTKGRVTAVHSQGKWVEASGKVLLYFARSDFKQPPRYGDVLLIHKPPIEITPPANPGEFDYKKFLSFQQIYYQYFLHPEDATVVDHQPPSFVIQFSLLLRDWAESVLKKNISGKQEQSIAIALVLGITDELDQETLQAYSASGAMHILAVSGLHIAILYSIIMGVGKPLQRSSRSRLLFGIISMLLLWLYAFITGLSPSVLRAVTMFSFISFGKLINRQSNIYNILAATAFCLLIYNPYFIVSVGFQLSFVAVLGIVYLHPRIYQQLDFQNRIIHYAWETTSVSVAAQLVTFALGLLYFHQFPNYFLITNLVVILASNGILIGGITMLTANIFSPLAQWIGFLVGWLIKCLNTFVFWIESLPYSVTAQIYITTPQFWVITGIIVFLILTITHKEFKFSLMALICACWFTALQWHHYHQQATSTQFIVYHVRGHAVIDFIRNGQCYMWTDNSMVHEPSKIRFHIAPHRMMSNAHTVQPASQLPNCETPYGIFIYFGKKIFLIRHQDNLMVPPAGFPADYVIFSNEKEKQFSAVQSAIPKALCIFTSSNSIADVNRITRATVNEGLIYSVPHRGACQQNL